MSRLLNLGCGDVFHPDWVNVDRVPRPPHVLGYDLRHGVPFPDAVFDVVYHSCLLERFSQDGAAAFLRECRRVLLPGGVLRLAASDLENIVRAYLQALEEARQGEPEADARHAWMATELLDPLVRQTRGGGMRAFLRRGPLAGRDFALERLGPAAVQTFAGQDEATAVQAAMPTAQEIGQFRLSGECSLWRYDRRSLTRLLLEAGFEQVRLTEAAVSAIPDFARYGLDVGPDGQARRPNALFMEARRPAAEAVGSPRVVSFCMQHSGGAGGAALRLHQGLELVQASSFLYVVSSKTPTPSGVGVIPAAGAAGLISNEQAGELVHPSWPAYWAASRARLAAYPGRPGHYEIFSDCRAQAEIAAIPGLDAAQIIHLHWIAGTLDPAREVEFLRGRPIVWTLHDMNPFTGGCHYAEGCRGFERYCGRCPQLGSNEEKDYSREQWTRKKIAYRELDITVVCPSRWLAAEVRRSSLLGKAAVRVIPNGVPTDVFKPMNRNAIRQSLGIAGDAFVVVFGSDALRTRRKGFPELLAALEHLRAGADDRAPTLLTFGSAEELAQVQLPFPCLHLGSLSSPAAVAMAYNAADCLAITSLEDNLPNVVLEAMACGLPVAGFATGGIPDMVDGGTEGTGRLVPVGDARALAAAVAALRDLPAPARQRMRLRCRQAVLQRFTLLHQGQAYKALYEELLRGRPAPGA